MKFRMLGATTAVLAVGAVATPTAEATDDPNRIVGGTVSTSSPGVAALYAYHPTTGESVFDCTSSMLSETKVLTARHCVDGIRADYVRVGSLKHASGGTTHKVSKTVMHSNADLAILTLATPATGAKTAKLATADPAVGETNTLYGWGRTSYQTSAASPDLKQANVRVAGATNDAHGGAGIKTTKVDGLAWKGDSGGPQINAAGVQVGVCSWGQPGSYQVYTSVAKHLNWIKSNAGLS